MDFIIDNIIVYNNSVDWNVFLIVLLIIIPTVVVASILIRNNHLKDFK